MKLENNSLNYAAIVVEVGQGDLVSLEGLDNLVGFNKLGMTALVSKDVQVGDVGVLFPTECQLSAPMARSNNLYRNAELNKDKAESGYLEDNRRVKCLKLRGHISSALFMPLSALEWVGGEHNKLAVGSVFTHLDDELVCQKYIIKENSREAKNKSKGQKKNRLVNSQCFPEHDDTSNLRFVDRNFKDDDYCYVLQKLHGCNFRAGNVQVYRWADVPWYVKLLQKLGVPISTTYYSPVAGSRRVVKYKEREDAQHYYDTDVWNKALRLIEDKIPKNWILYGELVGWADEKVIQKNYDYQVPKGEFALYIFKISVINDDGLRVDLHWDQVKDFCAKNGLMHAPELERGYYADLDLQKYMDVKFVEDLGMRHCVPLSPKSPCDEGIVLTKYVGQQAYAAKLKSPNFLLHETKAIDNDEQAN